jgi:YggT family protein
MAQIISDQNDTVVESTDTVVIHRSPAARVIGGITSFVLAIIGIRFILVLLGANPDNAFANLVYTITHPFVAPFFGLFGYTLQLGVSRFEFESLVAMLVYALIGYGLVRMVSAASAR